MDQRPWGRTDETTERVTGAGKSSRQKAVARLSGHAHDRTHALSMAQSLDTSYDGPHGLGFSYLYCQCSLICCQRPECNFLHTFWIQRSDRTTKLAGGGLHHGLHDGRALGHSAGLLSPFWARSPAIPYPRKRAMPVLPSASEPRPSAHHSSNS